MNQKNRTENINIPQNENISNGNNQIEDENLIINFSFSKDYANLIRKDLIQKDNNLNNENNNETILEQKINKEIKKDGNIQKLSSFIQSKEINILQSSLNFSLSDITIESEYLSIRIFPSYDKNEFEIIKQKVSKNLNIIKDYLLNRQCLYKDFSINKTVGPLLPLTVLIENAYSYKPEYKNSMNKKYQRLKNYICNFRTIYGDGNCYYRAVMFRYIELLILNKKSEYLKLLIIDIYKSFQTEEVSKRLILGKEKILPDLIVQIMIILLELIEKDEITTAHQVFYKSLLYSKQFDFSLILYFRFILYDYIKKNEKKLYMEDFPVLIGNLLPSQYENDGVFDFNSFYEKYLLKMFVCAEKIIIYLTPFVLGINVDVILFDDEEDEILKHFKFVGKDELNIKETIFIIHKKGHYENIFNYEDNKNFNEVYSYYRNNLKNYFIDIDKKLLNDYNQFNNTNNNQIIQKQNSENKDSQKHNTEIEKNNNNINNNINNQYINNNINNLDNNNYINNQYINNNPYGNNKVQIIKNNQLNETKVQRPKTARNYLNRNNINQFNNQGLNPKNNNYRNYNNTNISQINYQGNKYDVYKINNYNFYQQKQCEKCLTYFKEKNMTLNNICKKCLSELILAQLKYFYIDYLKSVQQKINVITINDFNIYFLSKFKINIENKNFNIYQIIDEYLYNSNKDKNEFLKELILFLKSKICLLCYNDINNNSQFKIICKCNFCSIDHLKYYFKEIVKNRIKYNYKCICTYEYKPNEVLELCTFLFNNKLYHDNQRLLEHLERIFSFICSKCGKEKMNMHKISVNENFNNNFCHYICDECIKSDNKRIFECIICNKEHNY